MSLGNGFKPPGGAQDGAPFCGELQAGEDDVAMRLGLSRRKTELAIALKYIVSTFHLTGAFRITSLTSHWIL